MQVTVGCQRSNNSYTSYCDIEIKDLILVDITNLHEAYLDLSASIIAKYWKDQGYTLHTDFNPLPTISSGGTSTPIYQPYRTIIF